MEYLAPFHLVILGLIVLLVALSPLFCWMALGRIEKQLAAIIRQLGQILVQRGPTGPVAPPVLSNLPDPPAVLPPIPLDPPPPAAWRVVGTDANGRRVAATIHAVSAEAARERAATRLRSIDSITPAPA
jgi:hypothetical protein